MPSFMNGDVEIDYLDDGAGEPVMLVHGFASNKEINWVQPSWISALTRAGRRAVALDHRGHGASTKLYEVADYGIARMAQDVIALMDHLAIESADVLGYSMGGRVTGRLAADYPERVRSAVIAGIGILLCEPGLNSEQIAQALEAPDVSAITDKTALAFRLFAQQTRSDRKALAANIRNPDRTISREAAAAISVPVLVATGTKDDIAGSGAELADLIPGAKLLDIPGRDHMLAVGDRAFKDGVLEFLSQRP